MYIQTDGDIRPCMFCPEELSFGNAREESLEEVWKKMRNSENLQEWKNKKLRNGKCGDCSQFESCKGCLARTFRLSKDISATDPCCPLSSYR